MASVSTDQEESGCPKTIDCGSVVADVRFHPQQDVIAAGCIDGVVKLYSYSPKKASHELMEFKHHKKACRCVRYSESGEKLFTASKDKSLSMVDLEKGVLEKHVKKAHESSLYSLLVVNENIIASGDDDGTLKVWDLRQEKVVMETKENEEFISDMVIEPNNRVLVTSSGEGCITAFDIRKHKMKVQSELFDSELLSLGLVKDGRKLVCGSGEGILNIFNWGEFGNISDRFPGHPESIDCICPINSEIICTGSLDGKIRAVNILPNRFIGVVGEHDEFPVENLSMSRCSSYLASCSHDNNIKFWDIKTLPEEEVSDRKRAKKSKKNKPLKSSNPGGDFFADLREDGGDKGGDSDSGDSDSDDSDSDDSDDEPATKKSRPGNSKSDSNPSKSKASDSKAKSKASAESEKVSGDDTDSDDSDFDEAEIDTSMSHPDTDDADSSDSDSNDDDSDDETIQESTL